jgi:hypothetical protein
MSSPPSQAPPRLLDDPTLDAGLRRDLELARSHAPIAYSVDAGLARFEATLTSAGAAPAITTAGGTIAGLRVLGWFVGVAALVGVGVGLLGSSDATDSSDPIAHVGRAPRSANAGHTAVRAEEQPVVGLRSSAASAGPQGSDASELVAEAGEPGEAGEVGAASVRVEGDNPARDLDAPEPPRPTPKASGSSGGSSGPHETAEAEPAGQLDEATQINAARLALASDPGKALALVAAAEKQFPNGSMIQERRGYAILALVALDRTAEAQERADAYLERWPNGPLSRRIRAALER